MDKLLISPSPHIHSGDSIEKNMYGVLIALIPAFICSVVFFGMGAIIVTLTSVIACLFFEYVIQKFILKRQSIAGIQRAVQPTGVDYHHRCLGSHRHRENELWRSGLQHFQPRLGGTCILVDFLPRANDHLATCPRIQLLVCGRGNRCNAAFLIKRSCQKRAIRQQCSHG